jgi:hypothetical protein
MKRFWTICGMLAACIVVSAHQAPAAGVFDAPKIARSYTTWMARAFDQCNPATLSVVSPGLPTGGCAASHTVTDDMNRCDFAKLTISGTPAKIRLLARNCLCGSRIRVELSLRVTKPNVTTKQKGLSDVTFEDRTIECGPLPGPPNGSGNDSPNGYFTALSGKCSSAFPCPSGFCGNVATSMSLADCLGNSLKGLSTGNIEILDAALLDADNGNAVFMTPGIFR